MNVLHAYTRRCLKKNRVRTIMTIIGIALSVAMFTAVTEAAVSALDYMIEFTRLSEGDYHALFNSATAEEYDRIKADERIASVGKLSSKGYAPVYNAGRNMYIYLAGMDEAARNIMPIEIVDGRMPENSTEVLVPTHLRSKYPTNLTVGTELELELGRRCVDGRTLTQIDSFIEGETVVDGKQGKYTVVGFYNRLPTDFESYYTPGYTVLTIDEDGVSPYDDYLVMFSAKNPGGIYEILDEFGTHQYQLNGTLLALENSGADSTTMNAIYTLAAILIIIIMFGSVSLIYNSFSISLSERTRQFGILKSVGATRRQIRGSVVYEALALCVFGIPLGLLSGYAGISITFALLGDSISHLFSTLYYNEGAGGLSMRIVFEPEALAIAAVIGLVTTIISAMIPAVRASKLTPVEAIRQTADVNLKSRQVKSRKLVLKIFGFEGDLASKNFRRSKKRYRAVVLSLFCSIVLFITASDFCSYLRMTAVGAAGDVDADISVTCNYKVEGCGELFEKMLSCPHVDSGVMYSRFATDMYFDKSLIDPGFICEDGIQGYLTFVDDAGFAAMCEKYGLDSGALMNAPTPAAIVFDMDYIPNEEGHYEKAAIFSGDAPTSFDMVKLPAIEGYTVIRRSHYADGGYFNTYAPIDEIIFNGFEYSAPKENIIELTDEEIGQRQTVAVAAVVHDTVERSAGLCACLPLSRMEELTGGFTAWTQMDFYAKDYNAAEQELYHVMNEFGGRVSLYNAAANVQTFRALVTVINVMSYGFIILISLIALVNVFNTISTSIILRRREFAMLRSVGMTAGGFNRMMNYECLLYGVKSVAAGVPVSMLFSWLMFKALDVEHIMRYSPPWVALAVAVGSVFAVVFITMLYAMHGVKSGNTIETLRSENI